MTVTALPRSRHRMRRWVYAPTLAGLAAGALISGAGSGAAGAGTEPELLGITYQYPWRIHNFTDQILTAGDFHRDQGAGYASALAFGGTTPWAALKPSDQTAEAFQPISVYSADLVRTWGRVCYRSQVWHMPRSVTTTSDMYVFALDAPHGTKKLMITGEGGHGNIDMNAYGETC